MLDKKIKIGCIARDKISGFQGVVVGKTEWLYGCNRFGLQSKELHEGEPIDLSWFDEPRLEFVESFIENERVTLEQTIDDAAKAAQKIVESTGRPGGPRDNPSRNPDPSKSYKW